MKHWATAVLVLAAPFTLAGTAKISGTVVDEHNIPVKNMVVEAWPLDVGVSGGTPQAVTDEQGHFVLTVATGRTQDGHPFGVKWAVYPHAENGDYYPDLSSRFYKTDSSQARHIEIPSGEAPEAKIELKLGPKAGAVKGKVTDAATGAQVKPQFALAWAADTQNQMGESTSSNYRILLPSNTAIKLTVLSQGYKAWSYPGTINVGPGQDMTLDIQMEPLPTANR
jgi:hypothetical protein